MIVHDNKEYQSLIDEIVESSREIKDEALFADKIKQLEIIAGTTKDPVLKAVVLYHKSDIPYKNSDFDTCQKYLTESLQLCKEIDFTYYMMLCYNTLAIIDSERADFYSSFGNYANAFRIADIHPEYKYGCILLNNIGNLFVWLEEHETAIDFLIQSYHKYGVEKMDSEYILQVIVLNIIEEYSLIKEYENAAEWSELDIDFSEEFQETICMILALNKIDLLYRQGNCSEAASLAGSIFRKSMEQDNFIYAFRGYLRLLEYAILAKDRKTADSVLEHTEVMSKNTCVDTFQHNYVVLKYQYYEAFQKDEDDGTAAKRLIQDYVNNSEHVINQLRNTYSRRLIMENELLKVTKEKENVLNQNRQLLKDIELDHFTHILNKVSLEKYINEAIADKKEDVGQALFLIDIDYFKSVNDNYGHERGDELILAVVDMISDSCSNDMLFGRFGGDEFILFIKSAGYTKFVTTFAEELLEKARHIQITKDKHITLSIGIHIVNSKTVVFEDAFKQADDALYLAKRNGRDGYAINSQSCS